MPINFGTETVITFYLLEPWNNNNNYYYVHVLNSELSSNATID